MEALFETASIYLACFRASQRASTRGTPRARETSRSTAVMASDESVGRRTVESVSSCAVFQFPRQMRCPSGERTNWVSMGSRRCSRSVVVWYWASYSLQILRHCRSEGCGHRRKTWYNAYCSVRVSAAQGVRLTSSTLGSIIRKCSV